MDQKSGKSGHSDDKPNDQTDEKGVPGGKKFKWSWNFWSEHPTAILLLFFGGICVAPIYDFMGSKMKIWTIGAGIWLILGAGIAFVCESISSGLTTKGIPIVTPKAAPAISLSATVTGALRPANGFRFIPIVYITADMALGGPKQTWISAAIKISLAVEAYPSPSLTIQGYQVEVLRTDGQWHQANSVPTDFWDLFQYPGISYADADATSRPTMVEPTHPPIKIKPAEPCFDSLVRNGLTLRVGDSPISGWLFLVLDGPAQPIEQIKLIIQPSKGPPITEFITIPKNIPPTNLPSAFEQLGFADIGAIPCTNQLDLYSSPRRLIGEKRAEFVSQIKRFAGQKVSIASPHKEDDPDQECQTFESDFVAAFKDAKWSVNEFRALKPFQPGVKMLVSDKDVKQIPDAANVLGNWLIRHGYTEDVGTVTGSQYISSGEIGLYIYPIPPPPPTQPGAQ
jgi:hypothetical protein